jgi:PAS domain S-box-containing protein
MLDTLANNAWALLFTGSLDPMVIVDAGGAVVRSNPAAHDLFGYTEEQFKGLSVDCLLPERYRARHAAFRASYMLDAAKRPMSARAPLYAIRSDGTEFLVEISLNPLVDGLVLASIQDVTERRRDEDALRKFRRVVEQATSTVIITDARGIIEYVNPRFTEISGYSTDEAVGKHSNLIKSGLMSPETYRDLWSTIAAGAVWRGELLNRRKDGSTYWDFVVISPMRDDSRRITHFVSIQQNISERKRAEEALRLSEERLKLFIDHAPVALAMFDKEMCYLAVSRRWLSDYSLEHDAVIGRSHYEVFPDIPERWRDIHRRALNGVVIRAEEDHFIRENGGDHWLRWEIRPWRELDGDIGGLVLFTEDITARKQAEARLAEREAQYQAAIDTTTDGYWMADETGQLLSVNHAYARLSGFSRDALLGMNIADLDASETAEEVRAHIEKVRCQGSDLFETSHRTKSGEVWPAEINASYSPEAGGLFFGFLRDISERKRSEAALRDSEERFRATFEQAAVGIAHVAPDGRWLRVNRKLCEIVGYSHDELQQMTFQAITHPDDLEADLEAVNRLLSGEIETSRLEKRYIRRDSSITWINLTVALVRRSDGDPDYFISVVEDISARKRTEAMLQELQAEMDQVMQFHVASQTIAAIAHELNTPLHAVCNYAEAALRLLIAGNPEPDLLRHALISAAEQSQRAGTVVRELLAFMKKGEVDTEPLDLNQVVRNVLARIDREGYGGFEVGLDLEPNLAPVAANRLQVEKVLTNLIENGVEAMHEAGVDTRAIVVKVRTCPDRGDMARVIVQDSGPGIDEKTMHRIFDPFYSTKTKGLGMGLAISRAIVESHGGQLWCESAHGAGASFHFTLPLAP